MTTRPTSLLKATSLLCIALIAALLASCNFHDWNDFLDHHGSGPIPDSITFQREGLYPEGIRYDEIHKRFLVSSIRQGIVGIVKDDGSYIPFIEDESLISTTGIHINYLKQQVLVCNTDVGVSTRSTPQTINTGGLGIFDLKTGVKINYINLTALLPDQPHLLNDVTMDNKGNAYVTDSFSPVIYKVNPAGHASIFVQNSAFQPVAPGAIALNGIVFHPHGYLIVGKYDENKLFKIPVNNPQDFEEIQSSEPFVGPDGLLLKHDNSLVVVSNVPEADKVYKGITHNNWSSAHIQKTFTVGRNVSPTTATSRGKATYVLYGHIRELLIFQNTSVSTYTIKRVNF